MDMGITVTIPRELLGTPEHRLLDVLLERCCFSMISLLLHFIPVSQMHLLMI